MAGRNSRKKKNKGSSKGADALRYLMVQRSDRGVTIGGLSGGGKDKEKEKKNEKAPGASARKPNKDKGIIPVRTHTEDGPVFSILNKHMASSPEVQILEKGSEPAPRILTVPSGTSFFKEPKAALKALNGLVLEEDQKYLLSKRRDLVEELTLASHKLVQIGHAFDHEGDRHSSIIKRIYVDHESLNKDRDDFQTKLETATSELSDLRLIAQDKESELLSNEREKTKKAEEESSMLKGTVESLSSRMVEMERRLVEAEDKLNRLKPEQKLRVKTECTRNFSLVLCLRGWPRGGTATCFYLLQLLQATSADIPSPAEDSDSEKDEEGEEEEKEEDKEEENGKKAEEEEAAALEERGTEGTSKFAADTLTPTRPAANEIDVNEGETEAGLTLEDLEI